MLSLPAGAQTGDDVSARVVSFSGWAAPDRPLALSIEVRNSGSTALTDVAVRLTIFERVHSRSALRASLDGNPSGGTLALTTEQLDQQIDPGGSATIPIQRDLGSLATSFRSGRGQSGVYPLGISVEVGGRSVVERSSAIVFLANPPDARLNLVWVMPVHDLLAGDAFGVYNRTLLARELAPTGRLPAIADLLIAHAGSPLTLAPSGVAADQLLDVTDGFPVRGGPDAAATDPLAKAASEVLARLHSAFASTAFEIASSTYARAGLATLVANGLSLDAGRQVTVGRERVASVFGRVPDPGLFVDGGFGADARSARTYAAVGAKTLVLDEAVLHNRIEGRFGPDRVVDVHSANLDFDGLLVDSPIRSRLELPSQDPVLTAMGVTAETAASYFELPALAAGRMLVVATASTPDPAIAAPLLDALSQAPWIRMRTASDADADPQLRPAGDQQQFGVAAPVNNPRFAQSLATRSQVDALGRVILGPSATEELARLNRIILASESADYDQDQSTAVSLARGARSRAQRHLELIKVPPRRVTLTARGGQVPVTVVNETGYTIRVRVRLDSQKVKFPTGDARVIEIPGKDHAASLGTIAFGLEARAAGSFPIIVRLETPDGHYVIGSGQILVRSTAVSAVTFMATAGGVIFLVGAWARRTLSRRPKSPAAS